MVSIMSPWSTVLNCVSQNNPAVIMFASPYFSSANSCCTNLCSMNVGGWKTSTEHILMKMGVSSLERWQTNIPAPRRKKWSLVLLKAQRLKVSLYDST